MTCNGALIEEGPMKGAHTPDLNGQQRFLRGGGEHSQWTYQDEMLREHSHNIEDPGIPVLSLKMPNHLKNLNTL